MRRCLRRNYQGSDLGFAANYEDYSEEKRDQSTPILSAEAISVEAVNEDEEHENFHGIEQKGEDQTTLSEEADQTTLASEDELVRSSSVIASEFVPELDERIVLELPSSMVRLLKVIHGTFQVTTRRINFIVDNGETKTAMDDVGLDSSSELGNVEKDRCWLMLSLHQIYSRRYLLRRSALELFMVDRSNFFFDFGSSESRRNAHRAIVQARPPYLNNIYKATQRPEQLLKRTQLTERWARWEISNFEYLIQLNTLAGRSYNDITQYPVFPWIISDYTSKSLDLSNPSSYRDLSKPIGALNTDRLKKFQERYLNFNDPVIPKFHYGSHYSSPGAVLYYLVRVEPFTTLSIQLQGGKFDHADRMFSDIAATWNGVLNDMSDVKELVPELFYLPEVLTNENSIDFGTTRLGGKLDSVRLPAWAENPVDFIHKHRMALENEYVSSHLHEWIDLIFGYKQRGKEAMAANNVFFHATYEGTVNIDRISDPVQQRATQDQIAYFGQTPSQLLTAPHVQKMPLAKVLHLQTIFRNPKEVKPYNVPDPEHCNVPAAAIRASSDMIVVVGMNAPAAHVAQHTWQPNKRDDQGTSFLFQHGKPSLGSANASLKRMFSGPASPVEEWCFPQALAFAASGIRSSAIVSITCDNEIITGGHADKSIRLVSLDGAKTIETAYGHCAPVTCLGLSPDSNYLVTGSRDTTVSLWRIYRAPVTRSSSVSEPSTETGTQTSTSGSTSSNFLTEKNRKRRIKGPIFVLCGHHSEILSCCVSSDLGIVVSCSRSLDVLLHSLKGGRLIRRLDGVEAHLVCLSSEGLILTWNESRHTLNTYTLNGVLIAETQLPLFSNISCMEISMDGRNALIGINSIENSGAYNSSWDSKLNKPGSDDLDSESVEAEESNETDIPTPSICFLDLQTLKIFHILRLEAEQDITALALNKDQTNLLVSTLNKQLIIFTMQLKA